MRYIIFNHNRRVLLMSEMYEKVPKCIHPKFLSKPAAAQYHVVVRACQISDDSFVVKKSFSLDSFMFWATSVDYSYFILLLSDEIIHKMRLEKVVLCDA